MFGNINIHGVPPSLSPPSSSPPLSPPPPSLHPGKRTHIEPLTISLSGTTITKYGIWVQQQYPIPTSTYASPTAVRVAHREQASTTNAVLLLLYSCRNRRVLYLHSKRHTAPTEPAALLLLLLCWLSSKNGTPQTSTATYALGAGVESLLRSETKKKKKKTIHNLPKNTSFSLSRPLLKRGIMHASAPQANPDTQRGDTSHREVNTGCC